MTSKSIKWLKNNKSFLNINMIEKEIGMPKSTLQKVLTGDRNLPDNWDAPVNKFVKNFKKFQYGQRDKKKKVSSHI